ncbi:hypothetical protein ATI61_113149 [Archangium gephyra]|uniref:Tetratricopeptide repeat protein n=1 Tax=Archangium gephyra TaxID=48 RepID=A0AAC8Q8F1_9BACT|nr:hypothetical protein [Archangium gephyra]AKJ02958.1 Hypothetical protein AA314_04584 [Archangium gephyra]REG25085.1 hypothetical protein ATI61_113149 [Archangium gephyra]
MSDSSSTSDTPQRSAAKTIALWIALICLFVAFYNYESGNLLRAWRMGKTGLSVLFSALLCLALVDQLRQQWRNRRQEGPAPEAVQLEDRGQLEEAARQWEALANQAPRESGAWVDFTLRQAWVFLRLGRGQPFAQLLEPLLSPQDTRERALAHSLLALANAMRGNLPRAESLLAGLEDEGALRGVVGGLSTQVLLSRRGQFEDALALAVPPWDIVDAHCRHHRHLWALLRAFALANLPPTPERERQARRTQAELRELRPGELDYFVEQWPELRAFLDSRLTVVEPPSAPGGSAGSPAEPGPQVFTSASFGLGLPARWDPLVIPGERVRLPWLLATLGGFVGLVFMNGGWLVFEVVLFGALVLSAILAMWRPWFQSHWSQSLNQQGIDALNALRLDDAARIYDELLEKLRGNYLMQYRQMFLLSRAIVFWMAGERSLARRILHALAHQAPWASDPRLLAVAWLHLADLDALEGNFERARASEGLAESLGKGQHPALWITTSLLLAIHDEDTAAVSEEAASLLAIEGIPEHHQRKVVLLQAFALERLSSPTPEQQQERGRLQARLRQQGEPGEFDYLAAEWPELRGFLASLGKTRAAA